MHSLGINGKSYPLYRFVEKLPSQDLIEWLSSQTLYPKVFWKESDSSTFRAAIGHLLLFSKIPQFTSPLPFEMRLYGGMRFSKNLSDDKTWEGFPRTCFWIPAMEISQNGKSAECVAYSLDPNSQNFPTKDAQKKTVPNLLLREETPHFSHWKNKVDTILDSIASQKIDKLVLARKTSLHFDHLLSPWPILSHLLQSAKRATVFAFQLSPTVCFLGATPEKLFKREGNLFHADAIAATRPRGKTEEEDLLFEQDLHTNPKEQREFQIVKDYLEASLSPLSEQKQWQGADCILKGSHVQHLYNRLNATLKNSISDADLIQALHPTPALGGFPRRESLALLHEIEPFDRGWYGAPLGVIGNQSTTLYVAIRSALIREHRLHLFAGTGIVSGSIAEREWDELEQKIQPFTQGIYC